jgi:hypothetical protein
MGKEILIFCSWVKYILLRTVYTDTVPFFSVCFDFSDQYCSSARNLTIGWDIHD